MGRAGVQNTMSEIQRPEDLQEIKIATAVENRSTMLKIAGTTRRTRNQTKKDQATINNLTRICTNHIFLFR